MRLSWRYTLAGLLLLLCVQGPVLAQTGSKSVRDVTPSGITPGPDINGPLKRVDGVEVASPAPRARILLRIEFLNTGEFVGRHLGKSWHIRLPELEPLSPLDTCSIVLTQEWPCGRIVNINLRRLVRLSGVTCVFPWQKSEQIVEASCQWRGNDLAQLIVSKGWARVSESSGQEVQEATQQAKENQLGIYRSTENINRFLKITGSNTGSSDIPPMPNLPIADILGPLGTPNDNAIADPQPVPAQ